MFFDFYDWVKSKKETLCKINLQRVFIIKLSTSILLVWQRQVLQFPEVQLRK